MLLISGPFHSTGLTIFQFPMWVATYQFGNHWLRIFPPLSYFSKLSSTSFSSAVTQSSNAWCFLVSNRSPYTLSSECLEYSESPWFCGYEEIPSPSPSSYITPGRDETGSLKRIPRLPGAGLKVIRQEAMTHHPVKFNIRKKYFASVYGCPTPYDEEEMSSGPRYKMQKLKHCTWLCSINTSSAYNSLPSR